MSDRRKNPDSREKIVDLPLPALSALQLARMILSAPVPEHIISCLPAQSLYMAVQALGLESAREIIEAASDEQYRLLLDLHLWDKDSFNEENFWDWLSVIDDPDSFDSLQHFQECLDPRLTALVIQRNVAVQVNEEPTEVPPGAGWYTPDKGYTWLRILCTEAEEHRLLGRFLALLFDQNPELFYQLIALPQAATAIELEEE
ncbi:MAG TPA: DUF6178 family protein, partial [Oligoflexia bacterium]|nr:DUF6178 family protein [Oligoflexia bacterium]